MSIVIVRFRSQLCIRRGRLSCSRNHRRNCQGIEKIQVEAVIEESSKNERTRAIRKTGHSPAAIETESSQYESETVSESTQTS